MRGVWGKPYGTAARVNIGQVILFIRTKVRLAWAGPFGPFLDVP